MKRKITAIMLIGMISLLVGTSIAYYNTKTFAFDENAVIFSSDNEKITFMDYTFYYKTIDNFMEKAKIIIPEEHFII